MTQIRQPNPAKQGLQTVTGGTPANYGLGGDASLIQHVHIQWDAALVGTVTFWSSEFPEVAISSTTAGDWIQENPTSGVYVAFSPAGAGTNTNLQINIPGGTAGGCSVHLGNLGSLMLRAQVVCTTQGVMRIQAGGKE